MKQADTTDRHVTAMAFDEATQELTLTRNAGLPKLKVTIPVSAGEIVTQASHGFTGQHPVRLADGLWVKAQANSDVNAQTMGFVASVIDDDNFKLARDGERIFGNWIAETEYFLNPAVAGEAIPEPATWNIGEVRQSLGWSDAEGWLYIEIDVGDVIGLFSPRQEFPFDKDFEFCINAGNIEVFELDISAAYQYGITGFKLKTDSGSLTGVVVKVNGVAVPGLDNIIVTTAVALTQPTTEKVVNIDDVVTIETSKNYTGEPTLLKGKMIFMI